MYYISFVLIFIAVTTSIAQEAPDFVIGGAAGETFGKNGAPGYILSSLSDIKPSSSGSSSTFFSLYNAVGITDVGETIPASERCPVVIVSEGILTFGSLSNPQYLFPFDSNGNPQNLSVLSNPVWLGSVDATTGRQFTFIGPFNTSLQSNLYTQPLSSQSLPYAGCNSISPAFYAIYKRAVFAVGGYGQDFPSPPPNSYLATLADITSVAFIAQYNKNQGLFDSSEEVNGCCVFKVLEGYLYIDGSGSYLSPYDRDGNDQCGDSSSGTLSTPVVLGAGPWGRYSGQWFPELNFTLIHELRTSTTVPDSCSSSPPNSYAIYKSGGAVVPSGPYNCVKVDIRASYYGGSDSPTVCLADRWDYQMRLNETYSAIQLNSIDECSFQVDAHNMAVKGYNSTHLVAYTDGASNCACRDHTFVPYDDKSSSMYTVCYKTLSNFGFCDVLIQIDSNYPCPPVPPPPPLK